MTETQVQTPVDRKSEIVEAALALAFEVGPDAVTTSMIARTLKVSQPAIYKHFGSKDAIWLAVSDRLARGIARNVDICLSSGDAPEDRLRDLVLNHIAFVQEVPALPDIMVMRHASTSHEIVRQGLQREMAKLRNLMADLVSQTQEQGGARVDIAPADVVTLIVGVVQGLILRMLISRDPSGLRAEAERLLELQFRTLGLKGALS